MSIHFFIYSFLSCFFNSFHFFVLCYFYFILTLLWQLFSFVLILYFVCSKRHTNLFWV
jgi:hypothetical protein